MENERKRIRSFMSDHHLSYPWLIPLLGKKGLKTSKTELCEIFIGRRVTRKAEMVLSATAVIIDEYGRFYERV